MDDELLSAAQRGDAHSVSRLLATKASPNVRSGTHKMPALHWACASDEKECARLLLADERTDLTLTSEHGMSATHVAASANALQCLSLLLQVRVNPIEVRNDWQETPLHVAATAGAHRCISLLLDAGASPLAVDQWKRTAAIVAQQQGLQADALGLPNPTPEELAAAADAAEGKGGGEVFQISTEMAALHVDLAQALHARRQKQQPLNLSLIHI